MFHYIMLLSLILSRMMTINILTISEMLLQEMLYMHPVYVGQKSVKGICSSKLSIKLPSSYPLYCTVYSL